MDIGGYWKKCMEHPLMCALALLIIFTVIQNLPGVDIGLGPWLGLDTFDNLLSSDSPSPSQPLGSNEGNLSVDDLNLNRTPSTCYPQQALRPEDLLPSQESNAIQEFNLAQPIGEGILADVNLLDAGAHIGINSVGQSLRNANRQIRSEPPNPQVNVSPWMNTSISPDLPRRPLEIGESCGVGA
jgi:hypothetical protein